MIAYPSQLRNLVLCDLGAVRVALDADRVRAVVRRSDAVRAIDLARVLGVAVPVGARRILSVRAREAFSLVVGATVSFCEVDAGRVWRVPRFLAGMQSRIALIAVVDWDGAFSLLLDLDGLSDVLAEAT